MKREPDDEVLYFVNLAAVCEQFHALPGPGGVLEQDSYLMMGVSIALDAINEKRNRDQKQASK